jgi:concanavalin A-like lectin/glucanase superfamily protein
MRSRRLWIVTLTAAAVLSGAGPAAADSVHTVASWSMNESPGAHTMRDGSGNGLDGRIGREVGTGELPGGYRGYRFDRLEPDTRPTHPQHLVVVPDDADLDPGSREFSITLRLRTTEQFGNIIQKGQATVAGGSYKLQIPGGKVQCWFRGSAGSVLVTAPRAINDGRWHTVQCWRNSQGVALAIDGSTVAAREGATGTIANSWPVSIGGKTDCDQIDVGCDYFAGDLDAVEIQAIDHNW